MALSDQDGHTHSHLRPEQRAVENVPGMPDRGHWVGPGYGEPLPLEKPQSTLPQIKHDGGARSIARHNIRLLLEHQPMVEAQRRILAQALGVLETLA